MFDERDLTYEEYCEAYKKWIKENGIYRKTSSVLNDAFTQLFRPGLRESFTFPGKLTVSDLDVDEERKQLYLAILQEERKYGI